MAEVTATAEYQDDVTIAKERIYREEKSNSMAGHFQMEFGSGETPANKTFLSESDAQRESVDESVCFSSSDDDGRQSPVVSVFSMKSDLSTPCPGAFTGETGTKTSCAHQGRQSPAPSVTSMKSDQSMIRPIAFTGDSTKSAREKECGLCSVCPEAAKKSCLNCIASFCELHVRQHYTAKALQRHKLVEATADLEDRLCQQHYMMLNFFCETDQTTVCSLCAIREHSGHKIIEQGEHESLPSNRSQMINEAHPSPGPIEFTSVNPDSVSLSWGVPEGLTEHHRFRVTWRCEEEQDSVDISDHEFTVEELIPGKKYDFSVATLMDDNSQSLCVFATTSTEIPKPDNVAITSDLTSLSLKWTKPAGVDEVKYLLSLHCDGKCLKTLSLKSLQRSFSGLLIGKEYSISVSTVLKKGGQSHAITKTIWTKVPAPEQLSVDSVMATSANLRWSLSQTVNQNPLSFMVSYHSKETEVQTISADSCSTVITGLKPDTKYIVSVLTKTQHGGRSQPSTMTIHTGVPGPEQLTVETVTPTSFQLTWSRPQGMEQTPHSYLISYYSRGTERQTVSTHLCSIVIRDLKLCTDYWVSVSTKLENQRRSEPAERVIQTAVPPPLKITVGAVTPTSATLTWCPPEGMGHTVLSYLISYHSQGSESKSISADSCSTIIIGLQPCTDYTVSVCTKINDEDMSKHVEQNVRTAVPVPKQLKVGSVTATSAKLTWSPPQGMGQIPYSYQISYSPIGSLGSEEPESKISHKDTGCEVITDLQPDTKYNVSIYIKLGNGRVMKEAARTGFRTEILTKAFYTIVIGNTQNHHKPLKARLMSKTVREVNRMEDCDFILAFCVIVSRVGTDMEAALKEIPDSKPVILSVMHHTFDPDHVTPDTSRFVRGREITVVDILFHEDKGILKCQKNTEAEQKINKFILACPESKRSTSLFGSSTKRKTTPVPEAQFHPATHHKESDVPKSPASYSVLTKHGSNPGTGHRSGSEETTKKSNSSSGSSKEVTYCVIVTGNTLGSHKAFQKRLAERVVLPNEVSQTSMAQCSFLLVFCPVVSSVGADIERALTRIPEDKSSILVMMHHTFNPDYLPPEGRGYIKRSNILVVDCLFYEDTGLLKCQKNDEAFEKITKWILGKFPNLEKRCHNVSLSSATAGWMQSISSISSFSSFSWGFNRK